MPKAVVIVNPIAGRKTGVKLRARAIGELTRLFPGLEAIETSEPGQATSLASAAARDGAGLVIAVGGDGTAREAAAGIINTRTALAIVPVGSGNDFCRTAGVPRDVAQACAFARNGTTRQLDAARLNGQVFINAASFGFDAAVTREASALPHLRGLPLYLAAVFRAVHDYECPEMSLATDVGEWCKPLLLVAAANGQCYGGGMKMAPNARPDDGLLDLCIIDRVSKLRIYQCLPAFINGTHARLPEVTFVRSPRLVVDAPPDLPVQLDGDLHSFPCTTTFTVEVLPGALRVVSGAR